MLKIRIFKYFGPKTAKIVEGFLGEYAKTVHKDSPKGESDLSKSILTKKLLFVLLKLRYNLSSRTPNIS
jgi:hypothetical protein